MGGEERNRQGAGRGPNAVGVAVEAASGAGVQAPASASPADPFPPADGEADRLAVVKLEARANLLFALYSSTIAELKRCQEKMAGDAEEIARLHRAIQARDEALGQAHAELERGAGERQRLLQERSAQQAEIECLGDRIRLTEAERDALRQEMQSLAQVLEARTAALEEHSATLDQLKRELEHAAAALAESEAMRESALAAHAVMLASRSWRWTAPLRAIQHWRLRLIGRR